MLLSRLQVGLIGLLSCFAASAAAQDLSELERSIVDLYSDNDCAGALKKASAHPHSAYRPNIQAVIAACDPPEGAEALFAAAEKRDPEGDLIAVLHAISLHRRDPEAAKPHWIRVLMYARNESLREMAREALSGIAPPERPLQLSPWTFSGELRAGTSYQRAPWAPEFAWLTPRGSAAFDYDASVRGQRWFRTGSLSLTYGIRGSRFSQLARSADRQLHEVALPLALRVGPSEDLVFRPFLEHERIGELAFANRVGFGFSGVAYRGQQKQSVTGYIAGDQLLVADVEAPSQAHYHFDYQWEWFPSRWLLSLKFAVDNHSAARVTRLRISPTAVATGDFNQTHNGLTLESTVRHGFDRVSLGLKTAFRARLDSQDSIFTSVVTGRTAIERRNDFDLALEPHFLWRAFSHLQLYAYLRQAWTWSSVTAQDYGLERSHSNTALGLSLRTYWSSY